MFGQLTIIDLNECDKELVRSGSYVKKFVVGLCKAIKMNPCGEPLIRRFGNGNLEGYSLMQLIETSSVVVHLDEYKNNCFIDIFSCKEFDSKKAEKFCKNFFKAGNSKCRVLIR